MKFYKGDIEIDASLPFEEVVCHLDQVFSPYNFVETDRFDEVPGCILEIGDFDDLEEFSVSLESLIKNGFSNKVPEEDDSWM